MEMTIPVIVWALIVYSGGGVLIDHLEYTTEKSCLHHKNKVIMVGNIFYRKEAKCIMRIKHEKINISGVSGSSIPSL